MNEVDYLVHVTPLLQPKSIFQHYISFKNDELVNTIARIVNEFYHCAAMCHLHYHKRRNGQYFNTWEIVLYLGNEPNWLQQHETKLLEYINNELSIEHVTQITIRN